MKMTIKSTNEEVVLIQYFGKDSWVDPFEDEDIDETHVLYAVYNDEIDEDLQLGVMDVDFEKNIINVEVFI